jgi:hypothetical protein
MQRVERHIERFPKKSIGEIHGRKIEIQDLGYCEDLGYHDYGQLEPRGEGYGYYTRFKVWIDDTKYPKEHGRWYIANNQQTAINQALKEARII